LSEPEKPTGWADEKLKLSICLLSKDLLRTKAKTGVVVTHAGLVC
jgi:ABC-type lipoprotein export system ATPase subunit